MMPFGLSGILRLGWCGSVALRARLIARSEFTCGMMRPHDAGTLKRLDLMTQWVIRIQNGAGISATAPLSEDQWK